MREHAEWAVELVAFGKSHAGGWPRTRTWAVRDLTLRLGAGQVLALLGPNGTGKSTTLRALAGLVPPCAGECRVAGHRAGSAAARAVTAYVPESLEVPAHLTGREWLAYIARLDDCEPTRVAECLAWLELTAAADAPVRTYSKGMRQRLALAQAVLRRPQVLLLDEATNGLDAGARSRLNRWLREIAQQGCAVVMTSHLLAQTEALCDRIALLGGGRLLAEGTPAELLGADWRRDESLSPLERLYWEKCHECA